MIKKYVLPICLLAVCLQVSAQYKMVEEVKQGQGDEVVIPYKKYVLDNGLTVVLHEDKSDPLVHVDVTYHVGSAREEIGKSGFAHFFEHMMFQGSDNVGDEQHFKIITEAGGTLNGTTNTDRTNYFETVPSNQLEKMIWLEADRMGFLLDAVTQKKFEVQRATVKNERGQNYDNRPYGLVREQLSANLYPYGHPYSWLTIGYVEDLNRVNVEDLKNFFLRWYGPNNAVLTIGGDLDSDEVMNWVVKYFGSIERGPEVNPVVLEPVKLDKDRHVSMMDGFAKLPMLATAMPTVPRYHKDEAPLDCLARILGGDNNSILYQSLVKTQIALSANASHPTSELAGMLSFSITPKPGTHLEEMEKAVRAAIKEFETRGVTDDDIEKFQKGYEASRIFGLESVNGKVSQLASNQTFTGDPNYLTKELKAYTTFTKEDVWRVYNQYVKDKPMVIMSVLTKGNEMLIAAPDDYVIDTTQYKAPDYGYEGLKYTKPEDTFDRRKMPGEGEIPEVKLPEFEIVHKDDYHMIEAKSDEVPTITLILEMKGGMIVEQNDLSKVGLASMFGSMMNDDTKKHTAEEITVILNKMGSSVSVQTGTDRIQVMVRTLKKNLLPTLAVLEERLLEPDFKESSFSRIKGQRLESIRNSKTQAAVVASQAYSKMLYGEKSVFGWPSGGTEASLESLTLGDIENYYKKYVSRNDMNVILVGDVDKADRDAIEASLKKLPSYSVPMPIVPPAPSRADNKTVYLVDIPKAAQTEFRIGYVTDLTYDATGEYYKSYLTNYNFGGAFNSRININLREDKGWTYGARSGFSANEYTGSFTFSSGILSTATDSTLAEFFEELDKFNKEGVTEDELNFLKKAISQSEARLYETGFQKANFIGNILQYNLDPNFVDKRNDILKNITKKEVDGLAKKYFDKEKMNLVLAGDKALIGPKIEAMGYKVVELDSEGNLKEAPRP